MFTSVSPVLKITCEFTSTGLIIEPNLPYPDWYAIGQQLSSIGEWYQFAVGDWLSYGEASYGEKYTQALGIIPRSLKTLQNWVWVAKGVPLSVRVFGSGVLWSHHRAVVGLCEDRQVKYLAMVTESERHIPVRELEAVIQKENRELETALTEQGIPTPPKPPPPAYPDDRLFELETEVYSLKQQVAEQQIALDQAQAKPVGGDIIFQPMGETRIGWEIAGGKSGVIEADEIVIGIIKERLGI